MEEKDQKEAHDALLQKLRERYSSAGRSIPSDKQLEEGLAAALLSDDHAVMHQNRATRRSLARKIR